MSILYRMLTVCFLLSVCPLQADDTELFIADITGEDEIRPQVLIIFDNSGSMGTTEDSTEEFNPSHTYTNSTKVYWSKTSSIPSLNSSQYFYQAKNYCNASKSPLTLTGKYSGNLRFWYPYNYYWYPLESGYRDYIFDCKEDVTNKDTANPDGYTGYPQQGKAEPYKNKKKNIFGRDDVVTLYSANYIYWNENKVEEKRTRLSIAKEAITSLINSTPSVDFGLAVFNRNYRDNDGNERDGGRVISKVEARDAQATTDFIDSVNELKALTNTPLCETLYEVYRYYAGKAVYFGDDDTGMSPARDTDAEDPDNAGVYLSPFKRCQKNANVILMTDGAPTQDSGADTLISAFTSRGRTNNSYMPALSEWMYNTDIDGDAANGDQHVRTFTVGFGETVIDSSNDLLSNTAVLGGGKYFPAKNASELQSAFGETIQSILSSSSSLTSPAVANSNFDKTRSLDSIYFSMFLPTNKAVWKGNIKKLKLDNQGVLRDRNNQAAIGTDGNIKESASTYWGAGQDGDKVEEGGVAAILSASTSRVILSNISAGAATVSNPAPVDLAEPSKNNLKTYYALTGTEAQQSAALAVKLGVEAAELDDAIDWLMGKNVDTKDDLDDYRDDIFADPLHSAPLAIPYTKKGVNGLPDTEVVSLLVGTNAGFLHMFTDNKNDEANQLDDTLTENWAFIPEQLLKKGLALKDSAADTAHNYGMDLSPMLINIYDSDDNIEQMIAVVGMRRGGSSYYALDITKPAEPSFMWQINGPGAGVSTTSGFENLGQTWSVPVSGKLTYKVGTQEITAPVIIFGGGYDINKDTCTPSSNADGSSIETCDDNMGNAIYIVNALTGKKIWSLVGESCVTGDKHCLRDSIPAQVSAIDSDGDENIDRIYAGDSGGNIWRIDLVGTDTSKWTHIKLAELGGDTSDSDRRFFTAPVIARTYNEHDVAYDGVLIGSGNRAKPLTDKTTKNAFYLIHDYRIFPTAYGETGYLDKPDPSKASELYNLTTEVTQVITIGSSPGWQYQFTGAGEKALGKGTLLEGNIYFTSFIPTASVVTDCSISDFGQGWLYAVNIHSGANQLQQSGRTVDKAAIGAQVPDSLVIHSGVNEKGENVIRLLGVGQGDEINIVDDAATENIDETEKINSGTFDTGTNMMPRRIYSYFEEGL